MFKEVYSLLQSGRSIIKELRERKLGLPNQYWVPSAAITQSSGAAGTILKHNTKVKIHFILDWNKSCSLDCITPTSSPSKVLLLGSRKLRTKGKEHSPKGTTQLLAHSCTVCLPRQQHPGAKEGSHLPRLPHCQAPWDRLTAPCLHASISSTVSQTRGPHLSWSSEFVLQLQGLIHFNEVRNSLWIKLWHWKDK